ncbi:hypothetical protein PTTG_29328 [Puccinia triticina 1-1 BBBD Race 1]|uniref:Uncharacterized protein n=1 Tax=Puccinia triticina (isolate 1-1 / race 1 (BBBD)) TaxID=630390 RepID=A0A180G4Z3_PUCT1|nr:hypothetical protein PTTG_29328 [Puccinia triticina 1-1 BBBD Race 1]
MVEEMVKQTNKIINRTPEAAIAGPITGRAEMSEEQGLPIPTNEGIRKPFIIVQENLSREAPVGKETALSHDTDSEDSFKGAVTVTEPPKETDVTGGTGTILKASKTVNVSGSISDKSVQDKTNRQEVWDRATEAFERGDKKSTDFFLRLYGKMGDATSLSALDKPDILRSSLSNAINPAVNVAKRPADKTTIVFIKGYLPNHFDVGFTPYFNRNIREFRGPIPLTIFDKNWQRDAIHYYTNRRTRGDEKNGNYIGFEYPNEWAQTFSKWTTNHCNFYITFKDMYGYTEFANWILLHKENIDKIVGKEGFMTAFRYDMIVRQNAFSYQVTTKSGEISAVDILIFREEVKREAWRITLTLGENKETNNPYAIGGKKFGYDPNTGKQRVKANKAVDDQAKPESSSGRDYGGYRDYNNDDKRQRDHGYSDNQYQRGGNYGGHQGGHNQERGGYRDQGPSWGFKKKDNSSSAKEKET